MAPNKPKNIFINGPITPAFIAESIQKHSSKKSIGAHQLFLGQVRADVLPQGAITGIEYSAYETMALNIAYQISEDAFAKFNLTCMHIYHSLQTVEAGQICLFVFTSSSHRFDAVNACSYVVERIKAELPIWGKELFADNTYIWKKNLI
ncbi:MAG: molybdenum cofactor biosynthesis protein MoaE [Bacteroidia bacterium]|nr:molybdenum cofactor biosynthesis protein MoaE [Bacteroidia bacterium]